MELLCEHFSGELTILDKEIERLYRDNDLIVSSELFSNRETILKTELENYVSGLLKTKEKKYMRDKLAYDNDQAYNWIQQKSRKRNNKKPIYKETYSEPNDSDTSSASSLSSQVTERSVNPQKKADTSKHMDGNANALSNSLKRTPNTGRPPMSTRATTAKTNIINSAPNHRELVTNSGLTNSPFVQSSSSQVSTSNDTLTQSDFRPAPIFTQPVHDPKKNMSTESTSCKTLKGSK